MAMTQRELSDLLQVSPMAVSRALRGQEGVGEDLRRRIVKAARDNGLRLPRPALTRLAAGEPCRRRDSYAMIVSLSASLDPQQPEGPFAHRLLQGARDEVAAQHRDLVLCDDTSDTWPRIVEQGGVDGVILYSPWWKGHESPAPCPVPVVGFFLGYGYDLIGVDDFRGGQLVGTALMDAGHRQVAWVGPVDPLGEVRLAGLRNAFRGIGEEGVSEERRCSGRGSCSREQGADLTHQLLDRFGATPETFTRHCTAIAAYNDTIACGVRDCLLEHGFRIPDDISLTGFDDVLPPGQEPFGLATVGMPLEAMGAEAVRLIEWRLEHPSAGRRQVSLDVSFSLGRTIGPPRNPTTGK